MTYLAALENLTLKFRSGNSVPVTRASITREEWSAIRAELARRSTKQITRRPMTTDDGPTFLDDGR